MYFRYFVIISPWKRVGPFIWTNLNLVTQGLCVPSLVEIASVVLEKKIFFNFVIVLSLFCYYLLLEKDEAFYLNKLDSDSSKDACTKFGSDWSSGSGIIFFLNFVNEFPLNRYHFPLKKDWILLLNKLEFPLPKDALCQVLLKLAKWFWRIRFLNILNISPGKRTVLFIWTN